MKRSYTYLKGLLTLALAAFTGWMWAGVTSSFGVNFRTAEAQDIPADTAAGFTKSDYAQPTTWANLNGGNGKQDITVGGATLNVTWYSRGTWNSGADTSTLDGKLLYNYLDDTVNNGRQKAAVKITGLPADKQYAVALILSGDADNDGFNGKYSPVWINGETYSYVDGALVTGDAAVAATTWGNRRAANNNGPTTFIEGTNVMFVEGVTGSELIITSAMDNQNVSRLTIAGVQVWVTDTTVTAPAVTAPTDSDVISVNFHSGEGAAADGDGLVAAKNWHNTTGETGTIDSLTVVNGDDSVASSGTLTYKSKNTWGYATNVTTDFLKGYLDDGAHDDVVGATITATVPFENYSVIVYMATDTAGQFKPVIVNGTLYAGSATLSSVGYAAAKPSMMQNTSVCTWGTCQTATAAYGVNALRVDGLSGNLTIQAGNDQTYNGIRNRGGIAAIQIVNTGDSILSDIQKIDWSDKTAEELKVSELPELTKAVVELTLPAGATLIVDTALPADHSIAIVGDNVTVNITNWDIEKSAVESLISGATVTTAYTDTIGVEIDGVTYSYIFRGTTDATYGTVANWYTGKRVMGDQTKWFSVSGDVAPGVGGNMWHHMLLDGDMMDSTNVTVGEDGYKTISATVLEGWNLGYFVRNGVHLNAATLNKIQNGGDFTAVWRVDDTSKITIGARGNSQHNNLANYYIDNEEGMVFTEFDIADANYYFDEDGSVKLDGVSGTQTIKAITLDLGTVAEGRKVVSRKVIGFNSSTATYTVEDGAVTTSVETVAATEAVSLQNVGDYKFEQKEDGYYVSFVAYAEDDEIGDASTWTATEDTTWATEGNWTLGIPEAGADAVISIATDTTITIPAEGVTVGVLTVNGEGTLTIAGGKITAGTILANTSIAADETTLALAPMNIAGGKTVTYATTTTVVNSDDLGNTHALSLKDVTGAGTFVKDGTGTMGFFYDAANVTTPIVVNAGDLKVRGAEGDQNVKLNVTVKKDALLSLAAWKAAFTNDANSIKLEGGAQLWLTNGAALAGTVTIENAAETPAKICGSSFNDVTVAAAITGAGKVEFADGGAFNPTSGASNEFPCQYATTYSGVISGDLQVIISDTSAVTFTANNTYTGGTVIAEGVTVSVSNTNTIFGTGNVTGAGTVKIAGGTYNDLSLAQYTDANTTIVIPADNTVTGYFNSATWTCAAKIQLDGTLSLTNGYGAGKYTFTGPWTGAGSFSLSNANPADVVRITGDISGFTGDISVAGARAITFCAESTAFNQKYSGKICVHGDYAYTAKVNGTWSAPVVVENGAKIGGEGSIDNTLTFNAGSIIDGAVTATGDVTLNGAVTVSGEAGATVLTCANAASLDLTKFTAPDGLKCIAEDGAVKLAVAKVNVTIPTAPANTKWYMGETEVSGTIPVDPNTDVTLTLKADDGYVFADGSTSTTVTVNSGETGATVETPDVTAATPVAQVGETKYQTLAAAVAAGSEVTVIADIVTDGPITINKTVKINLGGKTITATNDESGDGVFHVVAGGDLTLDGEGTVNALGPNAYCMAVWADGGKVTIEGGTYTNVGATSENDGAHFDLIYVKNGGSAIITGGTFICETPRWTLNSHNTLKGTISITGGKFYDLNPADIDTDDGVTTWCADGYTAVAGEGEDEGYYVVTEIPETAVAMIGDAGFDTIEEAVAYAKAGDTIKLIADVTVDAPVVVPAGAKLDLNGKASTGTILGTIAVNGGKYITAEGQTVIGTDARTFESTDAVFTMDAVTGNISLDAGTVTAKDQDGYGNNWTLPGQTLTIKSGVTLNVPAGVTMQVNGTTVTIETGATLNIAGGINLYTADATITAAEGLTVTTTVAGCEVKYVEGVYTVVESIVIPPAIAGNDNIPDETKAAIKDAMEDAGVTEITGYSIVTTGSGTPVDVADVAAVLEVFEVTPTVDAGVLSVAYEFGISAMTNVGDTVTITAGVTGAEYRAGVEVAFYADGAEIGKATTTADSTTVSITDISATDINGKKITVKAIKQ